MVSQSGGSSQPSVEGDVRFDSTGRLEYFDGKDWMPLERVADLDQPAVVRGGKPDRVSSPDVSDEPGSRASS